MSLQVLEVVLFTIGIALIIYGFKKGNEHHDGKMHEIMNDLVLQMDEDNKELLLRIKNANQDLKAKLDNRLVELEKRIAKIEQATREEKQSTLNPKFEKVIELYQTGKTINQIAKECRMGHGEIQLIVELLKKGFPYDEKA